MEDKEIWIKGDYGVIYADGTVEKGHTDQGWVFKDYKAWELGHGICYIPELDGEYIEGIYKPKLEDGEEYAACYSKDGFLELVGGNEDLARLVFEMVDWQHPETLVDELYSDDEEFRQTLDEWNKKKEEEKEGAK